MKPRHYLHALLYAFALVAAPRANAAVSITVSSMGMPCYTTSTGAFLAPGSVIRVGYFGAGDLATFQTSNDYNTLNALFTPVAEGRSGGGSITETDPSGSGLISGNQIIINNFFGSTGHVFGSIDNITSNYMPIGTDLYVWVFNSANPASATEWGIYGSTLWEFPDGSTLPANESLGTLDIDRYVRGSFDNTNQHVQLSAISAVPEPGSLLMLVGASVLIRRRRR